ncbi:MAG: hypothetical protein V3W19_05945 [Desulfatiglandales bacterium]
MFKLIVSLGPSEIEALRRVALGERRDVRMQGAMMIQQALIRLGVLQDERNEYDEDKENER